MCEDTVGTNALSRICKSCGSEFVPFSIEQETCDKCLKEFETLRTQLDKLEHIYKIKECAYCGRPFIPNSARQRYCKEVHYGSCPVCRNRVVVKDLVIGAQACSEECRQARIKATTRDRYGADNVFASEYGKAKIKQTNLDKYGVEYYTQTQESKSRFKETMQRKYGVDSPLQNKEILEKLKRTSRERYGTDYPIENPEVRQKAVNTAMSHGGFTYQRDDLQDKIKETNMAKYGVENPQQNAEIRQKTYNTNLARYGVMFPTQSKEIQDKTIKTNRRRYGVDRPSQTKEVYDKIIGTLQEHFGSDVHNPMDVPELRQKALEHSQETFKRLYGTPYSFAVPEYREKIKQSMQEKYGVPYYCMTEDCNEKNYHRISKVNYAFGELLKSNNVAYSFERYIERCAYDICIDNSNYLVEINPTITHNSFMSVFDKSSNGLDKNYHLDKTNLARQSGFTCLHVWDWDDWSKVVEIIKPKSDVVYARKCEIRELDTVTCREFLQQHHLQGSCRGQTVRLGLYYQDELVMAMTFGKPRYNKNFEWELLRLCTKSDVSVVGGAERLWKYFLAKYVPNSIISYCDNAKFSGEVYTRLGMTLSNVTPPNKHWYNLKTKEHITNNLLLQKGFDNLFGTDFGKGTDNEQLMLEFGWLPIYDCGQMVFTYWK